jgi:transposase
MPTPPDSLPDDASALKALLVAAQAENERLIAIIKELQRYRFGPRSEKIDPGQLALMLEDVEQAIAASAAQAASQTEDQPAKTPVPRKRQVNRGALPKHLPREDVVVDIADKSCPCCNGLRVKIGEDVSERLDMIPARFKVIVTHRPKYACRVCEGEVAQAPAPEHLIEGGIPTENLIAAVVIAKYADHLPLYRQAQIYGRQGVELDRSTLADWSGRAAFALRLVHELLLQVLKASVKLFADETRAPVLDPGRRKTKTGQLWAYARDDRPWGGPEPPGVAYVYEPDRKHERPVAHLAGFAGILQVDGYGAYKALAEGGPVALAFCWAHYPEPIFMWRRPVSAKAGTAIWPKVDRHKTRRVRGSGGRRVCQAWASRVPPPLARCRHGPKRRPWPRASSGDLSRCIAQWWRRQHDRGSHG